MNYLFFCGLSVLRTRQNYVDKLQNSVIIYIENPTRFYNINTKVEKMKDSNKEIIGRVERAKRNYSKLTHITDKSKLSTEDKMKISLCKHFVQFKNEKRLSLKEMSELTKIPSSRLSNIVNYKINLFTLDKLIHNLSILGEHDARVAAYLEYATQVFEVPTLQVAPTKKLTKSIKDVAIHGSQSAFLSY